MKLRSSFVGVLVFAMLAAVGCGGSEESATTAAADGGSGLEKTEITVGTMPVVDTAPLQIAIRDGFFKAEGLEVKLQTLAGGAEAIPKLKSGELDISFGNYVSFFSAASRGVIDLKIVADGFQSAPGTHVIMVPKDSPIQTPADLKGKKIAVNTKRNVASMLVRVAAKAHGVELDEDQNFVEFPFPEMEGVLKSKEVDAAQVVEPFGTLISQSIGARVIWDTSQGPTKDFPIAGYAAMADFAAENPKTVAAFQRAMSKAQAAAADRGEVVEIIPQYTTIKPDVASSLSIGGFPTTLEASRLQRVADSMREHGLLEQPLQVQDLIVSAG